MAYQLPTIIGDSGGLEAVPVVVFTDQGTSVATTDDGEQFTTNTERERNVRVSLSGSITAATTAFYGFIDLSDNVNWPHDATGRIDISTISIQVDKASAARGTIALGIITRINATNADIAFIAGNSFTQNDTISVDVAHNFSPSQLKCDVVSGKLSHIKASGVLLNVAAVNTATPIPFGPGGATFVPAVGDAVIRLATTTAGDVAWSMSAFYHDHPGMGA